MKNVVIYVDDANTNAILQARNSFTNARTIPAKLDALTAAAFFVSNYAGASALIHEGTEKAVMTPNDVPDFETAVDLLVKAENNGFPRRARIAVTAAILLESTKFQGGEAVKNVFRHVLDECDTASELF